MIFNVGGLDIVIDPIKLGEILSVPTEGLDEYVWKTDEGCH